MSTNGSAAPKPLAILEPQEMFYGDKYGILQDPFGHLWAIATVVEELTPEEVNRRAMQLFASAK